MNKRTNLLIAAVTLVLLLAVIGQLRAEPDALSAEFMTLLYRSVQLFGFEGDWTFDIVPLPWELQIARVLAPLVALASIILVLARGAWVTLSNQRVRMYRQHVVLAGLNDLGWHFAHACAMSGVQLVAIDSDETNPRVDQARRLNIPVVIGDPLSSTALRRGGIAHAADVVAFLGSDAANVELTVRLKTILERRSGSPNPLRVHCHMSDPSLAHGLESYPKLFLDRDLVQVSFFNNDEIAARRLTLDHPADVYADALGRDRPHVVIVGATRMAREVLLHLANTAHFANGALPKVTVCAVDAAAVLGRIVSNHPGLPRAAEVAALEIPPSLQTLGNIASDAAVDGVSQFVICGRDDAESLAQALVLRHAVLLHRDVNAPILLHMRTSDGLTRMLESTEPDPENPDGLYPFGALDAILNEETVINARQDDLARALHENYLDQAKANDAYDPDAPSQAPWRVLQETYRRDNRHEADQLDAELRAVGCVETDDDATVAFDAAEIERLAHMEKDRFIAARYVAGWRHGLVRTNYGKITDLRPWDEISDRSYDLASAAAIPDLLRKRLRKGIRRECVIGVTGHRLDRVALDNAALIRAIERVLDLILREHPDASFTIMSPLAEGADRVVARIALERLPRTRLHVPLPLPYEIYTRDFGNHPRQSRSQSVQEFQALLGLAGRYFEMPLKFGAMAELEQPGEDGIRARARQYALAGAFIVQRSHEFIAVWDGTESALEGGTANVVSWRRTAVPPAYRFPANYYPEVPQRAPFIVPPDPTRDFAPQRAAAAVEPVPAGSL